MRPIYERPEDRTRQRECIDAFCAAFGCTALETPRLAGWDYALSVDGHPVALAEVKVRSNPMDAYPTYLISERKVEILVEQAELQGVAPLLIVQWTDAKGWCRPDRADYTIGTGGRVDRGDPADIEPVALIKISDFQRF
jgi:hypothetical protein